ncbi:sugar-binding transcriptional regulator [Oenococcus oeni]
MKTNDDITYLEKIANISHDYYLTKLSIGEISEKYKLSRYLISRYLDDALEQGLVKITINAPQERNFELEKKFRQLFTIKNIFIIKDSENPSLKNENVIAFAAKHIQSLIENSQVVGMAWGDTVYRVIDAFSAKVKEDLVFTQFIGENMKYKSAAGSGRMVEKAAAKYSAQFVTIAGPLYIVNNQAHELLKKEPSFNRAGNLIKKLDLIFCGIGTLSSIESIPAWNENKSIIFPGVNFKNVAGMLYGRPYNIDGQFLNLADDKVFGSNIKSILSVPRRIAFTNSKFKARAMLGALRGRLLTDIIIDESIAQRILMEAGRD